MRVIYKIQILLVFFLCAVSDALAAAVFGAPKLIFRKMLYPPLASLS